MSRFAITILSLILFANLAFAQSGLLPCQGLDCTVCDLGVLINNLITYAVQFAFLAAVVATFGGAAFIMASRGNEGRLTRGKQIIWAAAVGLAIVLSAWIIIDTVFKYALVRDENSKFGPWNQLQCPEFFKANIQLKETGKATQLSEPVWAPLRQGATPRFGIQPNVSEDFPE